MISPVRMSLIIVLAFAAFTATSAAAHGKVLVLKEEGKPVAMGTELGVELETSFGKCKLTQRAHMAVNEARSDKLTMEPVEPACSLETSEGYRYSTSGGLKEIAMKGSAGSARLRGSPLQMVQGTQVRLCAYDLRTFFGRFTVPGHAVLEGSAVGKLNKRESISEPRRGAPCPPSESTKFVVAILGHNNKPLETELIG